jgi:general secretion pathway protein G
MIVRPVQSSRLAARAGFTLLEVLIVVAILVVLAGVGGVTYMSYLESAKEDVAKSKIKSIETACDAYRIKFGEFPQALAVLTQPYPDGSAGPLDPEALRDPWEREFQYDPNGQHNAGRRPDIWTTTPGNKTIGNWR